MRALMRTLGLALVLLPMSKPMLAQAQRQPDTAFVPGTPRTGLENTTWSGNEDIGDNRPISFRFLSNGGVMRVDEIGVNRGSYRVQGSKIVMTFDEIDLVYTGTITGGTLRGMTRSDEDSWRFVVNRRPQAQRGVLPPFSGARGAPRQQPRNLDLERQPPLPPFDLDRDPIVPVSPLDLERAPFDRDD
jgi:hypothetical protein